MGWGLSLLLPTLVGARVNLKLTGAEPTAGSGSWEPSTCGVCGEEEDPPPGGAVLLLPRLFVPAGPLRGATPPAASRPAPPWELRPGLALFRLGSR